VKYDYADYRSFDRIIRTIDENAVIGRGVTARKENNPPSKKER
jgi:hypothetical protein